MTTISNINIVVQQGEPAKEAQQVRNPQLDSQQLTVAQQEQKEVNQREVVKEADDPAKIKAELSHSGKRKLKEEEQKKKKKHEEKDPEEKDPDGTGRLLDTIA